MSDRGGVPDQPIDVLLADASRHATIALAVAHGLDEVAGVRLHVLADTRWGPLTWSTLRETFTVAELDTDAKWLAAIEHTVGVKDIDVILTVSEPGGEFVARHREELEGLALVAPVPSPDVFSVAINKGRVTAFAAQLGMLVPRTLDVAAAALDDGSLAAALDDLTLPVLLKPTGMSAGRGIRQFVTASELLDHLGELPAIGDDALIIQEIVEGDDLCCSVLCAPGGDVVAHSTFQGLTDIEGRYAPWSRMSFSENFEAVERVQYLTRQLGWEGPANVDFIRRADGEYVLLEFNGRYDGEATGSMMAGVNFPKLHLELAFGMPVSQPRYHPGPHLSIRGVFDAVGCRLRGEASAPFRYRETTLPLVLAHPVSHAVRIITDRLRRRR